MTARAERRRIEKAARKNGTHGIHAPNDLLAKSPQRIELRNPVSDSFASFVFGNATICQQIPPHQPGERCDETACSVMVEPDSALGQHLVLCGHGPSLALHAAEYCPTADQIWGCNGALIWLDEHGHHPTHGFAVDQTAEMLREWHTTPDVEYLIASTVHPHLTQLLVGRGRRTRFFHNYVGIKGQPVEIDGEVMGYEDWMYCALYPSTVRAGSGLNAVNRAIDVATFMGFETITVLGADCCLQVNKPAPQAVVGSPEHQRWLEEDVTMHANGGSAVAHGATMMTLEGTIDGRLWTTKPDMMISAVWLEKTRQAHFAAHYEALAQSLGVPVEQLSHKQRLTARQGKEGRVRIIGDTLVQALKDKPDSYLRRLPTMVDHNGKPLTFG